MRCSLLGAPGLQERYRCKLAPGGRRALRAGVRTRIYPRSFVEAASKDGEPTDAVIVSRAATAVSRPTKRRPVAPDRPRERPTGRSKPRSDLPERAAPRCQASGTSKTITTEKVRVHPALRTRDRDRFRRRAFRHRPDIDGGTAALAQARSDGRNASTVPRPPAFRLRRSRWGAFVERFADHVSAKKSLVGQWSSRGLHGRNGQRSHLTLRFSADVLPRLLTSSYSTC